MADLLLDIVSYLTTNELVSGDGVDAFRDLMPEQPDNVVVVNEYTNVDTILNIGVATRNVQILVRDRSYSAAKNKSSSIHKLVKDKLDNIVDLTAERWAIMYPKQTPCKIQIDSNNRVIFGFNISVTTYYD